MSMDIVFAEKTSHFSDSKQLLLIKNVAHEHLLTRVEELGAVFAKWSTSRVRQFVHQELEQLVRQQRFPVNDEEVQWIAQALNKELSGLGPLDDLMADPEVEDILINGYQRVFVSRKGVLQQETLHFTDNAHVLRIVRRILVREGQSLNAMWNRRQTTKFNGASYVIQRGAAAIYTPEGAAQDRKSVV